MDIGMSAKSENIKRRRRAIKRLSRREKWRRKWRAKGGESVAANRKPALFSQAWRRCRTSASQIGIAQWRAACRGNQRQPDSQHLGGVKYGAARHLLREEGREIILKSAA